MKARQDLRSALRVNLRPMDYESKAHFCSTELFMLVGPAGLEPATRGFTVPDHFRTERTYLTTHNRLIAQDALACY